MSNAIIQQINSKKKKTPEHLLLLDDHAVLNLLTFWRLFLQGCLRHLYFHESFSLANYLLI